MKALVLALALCVFASPALAAEQLAWDFWPGETAATMVANHQYRANFDSGAAVALQPTCNDATRICLSQPFTFAPGNHTVTMAAFWTSVNLWSATSALVTFSVADVTAPSISVTSHTQGQIVTMSPITLAGTSADASGVASVTVNGSPAMGTTSWSKSVALTPGSNALLVQARDSVGNIGSLTRTVTYQAPPAPDTTAPTVSVTSHSEGQVVATSTITLQGTAADNVGVASVTVNGATATGTTAWSKSVTLTAGTNTLVVLARDAAGKVGSQSRSITYQPPTTCALNGVNYALGAQVTQTKKNGEVDTWLSASYAAGWKLVSRTKNKSQTTVTIKCG